MSKKSLDHFKFKGSVNPEIVKNIARCNFLIITVMYMKVYIYEMEMTQRIRFLYQIWLKMLIFWALFFPHCPKFWNFFHSKTPNRLEFEKGFPNAPYFLWLLSLKDLLFFALHAHVWEECCSIKHGLQKLENFVFLKQNCAIWWILLGAKLNQGD